MSMKSETLSKCHDKTANNAERPATRTCIREPVNEECTHLGFVRRARTEREKNRGEGIHAARVENRRVHASVLCEMQRPIVTV